MEIFSMTRLDIGWVTLAKKTKICVIYILPNYFCSSRKTLDDFRPIADSTFSMA